MRKLITVLCLWGFMVNAQEKKFVDGLYDYIGNTAIFELNQEEGRAFYIPTRS
jgi:beta-galactosidase